MDYQWDWIDSGDQRILWLDFSVVPTVAHWKALLKDILTGTGCRHFKLLCQLKESRTKIGREEFLEIQNYALGLGVEKVTIAMIVDDKYYAQKAKMLTLAAQQLGMDFAMESFNDRSTAENWLIYA